MAHPVAIVRAHATESETVLALGTGIGIEDGTDRVPETAGVTGPAPEIETVTGVTARDETGPPRVSVAAVGSVQSDRNVPSVPNAPRLTKSPWSERCMKARCPTS